MRTHRDIARAGEKTCKFGQVFEVHDHRTFKTRYLRILTLPIRPAAPAGRTQPRPRPSREAGFTMIEIAIAVGIIGFALVAIIGILPRGMGVQKENREDTIISQDAPYFMNAIRNGEMRTNNNILTNYVEWVAILNSVSGVWFTNYNQSLVPGTGNNNNLSNDMAIIGLLTTPEYDARLQPPGSPTISNQVVASVRGMTGSALQQNGANSVTAFRYQMVAETDPWYFNTSYPDNSTPDYANYVSSGLHELRLRFAWPILPSGGVGPNRQTYRTLIGAHLSTNYNPLWFFQPQTYSSNTNF